MGRGRLLVLRKLVSEKKEICNKISTSGGGGVRVDISDKS